MKKPPSLPPLQEGEYLPLSGVDLLEKQTKPKPLHTESSLLAAMENAGRELEDAELKASLKDAGIGTPATRAAIIETLFARQYIVREKKNLVPTDKGLAVYGIVKDKKIADVEMTGMWETALAKIEAGSMDADTFRKGIEVYATQITAELLSVQLSVATGETCPCPKCGSGRILFYLNSPERSNVDCKNTIYRKKCDKQLSDKQIVELVNANARPGGPRASRARTARLSMLRWYWTSSSMSVFHSPKRKRNRRNSLSLPLKFHCDRFYSL